MKKILLCLFLLTAALINAQNDDCTGAIALTAGTDFASGAATFDNTGATTDGPAPSCNSTADNNVWFTVTVPPSGNLKIETKSVSGSDFDDSVLSVYSGSCGSLNEIACDDDSGQGYFSLLSLTGQTPGATLYVSVWKYNNLTDSGAFQISAYDPIPPVHDECSGAIALTVGTDFNSGAITTNNDNATTGSSTPSCDADAIDNVWFKAVIPQSGNLTIKLKEVSGSSFYSPVVSVYSGTCTSLNEITCNDYGFSPTVLTGQTPGETVYISVWKYDSYADSGEFQIAAYDPIPPAHDECSGAIALTVGTDFNSGAITTNNDNATTGNSTPSCDADAIDNVWFKAVIPQSGNLTIKLKEVSGSSFYSPVVSVYSGFCNSLTEIICNDSGFSPTALTGQTPGQTVYISVWKYSSYSGSGDFQIAAYDPIPPANNDCSGATPLTVGGDFNSGAIISGNDEATTDGSSPSCNSTAINNVWFTVTVPPSGNLKIETQSDVGSDFNDSVITVYSGACGSLTELACDDDSGQGLFSLLSLTGQTPGETLYVSVWKYSSFTDSGTFRISAYDESLLSTHEVTDNKKKIMVSPNPFSDVLTISDISDVQSVSVTDVTGRMIKTIEKPSSLLDLRDLKEGLYFVTLKMKDGSVKTIKTIKK
ncbi:T9SS type A sorting domain-containing protein [Chryseobacterium arthrosphaerae]|uniref:T9SS type A sorting domain-containing protein n=1 Tax=Chryseobacterium arthrosphaerae TaxID=651561 RepID=UPI0023E30D6A|nr:T9SS type A sorting domain-containing protein [Chryseobacterium arthrosphaerae]WES96696.1 T9SS type A sorting domain-containing protein [Chryseobacterium arthrosphaerae]